MPSASSRFSSRFVLTGGLLMVWSVLACSSSSSSPSDGTDAAMPSVDSSAPTEDARAVEDAASPTSDATAAPDDDAPATAADDSAAARDAVTTADAHASAVDASAACASYCTCMATNCKDKVFGGGCLTECASQTTWDLPCRANMCSLVQAQPNNDHCTHAFGMIQCLNE